MGIPRNPPQNKCWAHNSHSHLRLAAQHQLSQVTIHKAGILTPPDAKSPLLLGLWGSPMLNASSKWRLQLWLSSWVILAGKIQWVGTGPCSYLSWLIMDGLASDRHSGSWDLTVPCQSTPWDLSPTAVWRQGSRQCSFQTCAYSSSPRGQGCPCCTWEPDPLNRQITQICTSPSCCSLPNETLYNM